METWKFGRGARSAKRSPMTSMSMSSSSSPPCFKKTNKPLTEKRRRARINRSLGELKVILFSDGGRNNGGRTAGVCKQAKLEKADILETAVRHLRMIKYFEHAGVDVYKAGFVGCMHEVERFTAISEIDGDAYDKDFGLRMMTHLETCACEIDYYRNVYNEAGNGQINETTPMTQEQQQEEQQQPQETPQIHHDEVIVIDDEIKTEGQQEEATSTEAEAEAPPPPAPSAALDYTMKSLRAQLRRSRPAKPKRPAAPKFTRPPPKSSPSSMVAQFQRQPKPEQISLLTLGYLNAHIKRRQLAGQPDDHRHHQLRTAADWEMFWNANHRGQGGGGEGAHANDPRDPMWRPW